MTGELTLDITLFFVSVIVLFVLAIAEIAIVAASRSKLETLQQEGDARASVALKLKGSLDEVKASVRILSTFVLLVAAAIILPVFGRFFPLLAESADIRNPEIARIIGLLLGVFIVAGFLVIAAFLVPKALGVRYADLLCLKTAGIVNLVTGLLRITRKILLFFANILLKPFSLSASYSDSVMSEESIMDMLQEGTRSGILDQTEHELIESIIDFTDKTAREIMIPRKDIVALDFDMAPDEVLQVVLEEGFTRMPVFRESLDDILGIVYAKDVVNLIEHKNLIILQDILRPSFVVPETKPISELLREFQLRRIHLAVVVDEFGGTEGIITLEDILEEIVGDIVDEYDKDDRQHRMLGDGAIEVDGIMNISDFNDLVDFSIPESDDYDTIGGFITTLMGRIPGEGDRCSYREIGIEVVSVDELRIEKARFYPPPVVNDEK